MRYVATQASLSIKDSGTRAVLFRLVLVARPSLFLVHLRFWLTPCLWNSQAHPIGQGSRHNHPYSIYWPPTFSIPIRFRDPWILNHNKQNGGQVCSVSLMRTMVLGTLNLMGVRTTWSWNQIGTWGGWTLESSMNKEGFSINLLLVRMSPPSQWIRMSDLLDLKGIRAPEHIHRMGTRGSHLYT